MTDDTFKTIFKVAASEIQNRIGAQGSDAKEKLNGLVARERHYGEFSQFLRNSLADIIVRGRQQEQIGREFYEKEMSDLLLKVNKIISDIKEESLRQSGAVVAYETSADYFQSLPAILNAEIEKARDLQARAEAGELTKRKVGARPDKLKDVRNYVVSEADK